jgi:hypothetical protein
MHPSKSVHKGARIRIAIRIRPLTPLAASVEEAAMPTDEADLAELRQANECYAADYEQRLAADLVAMLPDDREAARRVWRYVDAILSLTVEEPEGVPGSADA